MPHIWLGVSVEDQERADERIPLLLQTPAAVRWISAEPLLGPVDNLFRLRADGFLGGRADMTRLDWVVAGAESGPRARPMNVDWVRSLRDQCASAGVAFFYKQNAHQGHKIPLPMLDGVRHVALPA
jgi:protein gp37